MPDDIDKFWSDTLKRLRRAIDLHPLCPAESEQEYAAAEPRELPQDKFKEMLGSVVSGRDDWNEPEPQWTESADTAVSDREFQFNRNLGDEDPEVDKRVDELRRKELGTDDEAPEDETGVDGGTNPQGKGG